MDLADSLGQAFGKPKGMQMPQGLRESPEENRQRMQGRLGILQDEAAAGETSPAHAREIASTRAKIGEGGGVADEGGGLAASIEAALKAPAPKASTPKSAPGRRNEDTFYKAENLAPITGAAETALNVATGIGTSIVGGFRGLAELARGGSLEDATKAVHGTDENAVAKTYDPQTAGGKAGAEAMASPYNPLNWIGAAANWAGAKTTDAATRMGASPEVAAGAGTAVNTGLNAAPMLLLRNGQRVAQPAANEAIGGARAALPAEAGGESMPLQKAPLELVPSAKNAGVPNNITQVIETKPRLKGPAAVVEETKPLEFADSASSAGDGKILSAAEQAKRAEILQRVGVQNVRRSAVEGSKQAAADDFQQSKLNNASGQLIKQTLEHEREALATHAEKIVSETGGTTGLDETARAARGNTIVAPLDSLKQWFDTNIGKLYKAADEKAGGVPVDLPEVHNFVVDHRARFLGTVEGKQLLEGVTERMKSLGMADKEGNPVPVTVAQAEKLNQYLGEVWTPRTGRLIGELKDNILEGVSRSAGEDIYKQARALRAMRASTLDNPNGISKIMDASGPEGINRSVAIEKIPDAVTGMPVAQLKHVLKTLEHVPQELQPQSAAALGEIKAHFANKVAEIGGSQAGQWNAKGVSKYLKDNSAKIEAVFSKEEIAKLKDLNDAGQILAKDQSYPGAAVQEHNLIQRGAMESMRGVGAATGGAIAGPPGAAAGGFLGGMAAKKFGEAASLKAAQKRVMRLSDFPK